MTISFFDFLVVFMQSTVDLQLAKTKGGLNAKLFNPTCRGLMPILFSQFFNKENDNILWYDDSICWVAAMRVRMGQRHLQPVVHRLPHLQPPTIPMTMTPHLFPLPLRLPPLMTRRDPVKTKNPDRSIW